MKDFFSLVGIFAAIIALGIVGIVFSPRSDGPPDWDETSIVFESDEEMRDYDDFLTFDTDGLTGVQAERCLSFETPQDKEARSWSYLSATYSMADASRVFMKVYPDESSKAWGLRDWRAEERKINLNGVSVEYQKIEGRGHDFRTWFTYNGYAYAVYIYSPANPNVLVEYLQRILPQPN